MATILHIIYCNLICGEKMVIYIRPNYKTHRLNFTFFFFSFQSSKFHLFLIELSVNVLLVIAIHLLKRRRFGYYYYYFLISRKLKIVNSGERCRSLAHLITKIIPTPTDIYLHLSLLHSSSNLKQLIRQSWFSMVNMHNDAEIPYTRTWHWNLQLPNENKKSSSKANTPESMEEDWQRTGREEGETMVIIIIIITSKTALIWKMNCGSN